MPTPCRTATPADSSTPSRHGGRRVFAGLLGWVPLLLLGAGGSPIDGEVTEPNILILIADDLGVDRVEAYGHENESGQPIAPRTPNIDALATSGVLFRNAWGSPLCSPSRAMALTGLNPSRCGIGRFIPNDNPEVPGLNPDLLCLPDALPDTYVAAAIGKWHLATAAIGGRAGPTGTHALQCGFDVFRGTAGNLQTRNQNYSHFDWATANAESVEAKRIRKRYVTSFTTDEALATIEAFGDQPWLLWVGYHAPHRPLHVPPKDLLHSPDRKTVSKIGKGKAMIEALDRELGRLIQGIDPDTWERTLVIFFGDNGTQRDLIEPPFVAERGKGTVYSNGVQIPFIVSGGALPEGSRGQESLALASLTDLLPTIAELTGGDIPEGLDGRSLRSALSDPSSRGERAWLYGERFDPNFDPFDGLNLTEREFEFDHRTIRDERYKLVVKRRADLPPGLAERVEFYDVLADPHERISLLDPEGQPPAEAREAFEALTAQLDSLRPRK